MLLEVMVVLEVLAVLVGWVFLLVVVLVELVLVSLTLVLVVEMM